MNQKQRQRLGSAIACTVLSYAAVSLAGIDKAQAAVLTYNIQLNGADSGFLKVNNSSLTGIEVEEVAVSEGRLYGFILDSLGSKKEYENLAGDKAVFERGNFRGLRASGGDYVMKELIIPPDEPYGPLYIKSTGNLSWHIETYRTSFTEWTSFLDGYQEVYRTFEGSTNRVDRSFFYDEVSYTLVDTAAEPVPEPIAAGGTALGLAGLSWLKHKKKMAA